MNVINSQILESTDEDCFSLNLPFPPDRLCHTVFFLDMAFEQISIPVYLGWVFGQLRSLEFYAQEFLHFKEQQILKGYLSEKRRESFLLGRYAAKLSLAMTKNVSFKNICIEAGIFNHPIVYAPFSGTQISISHTLQWGAALSFPDSYPMGLDIEKIDGTHMNSIASYLSFDEKMIIKKWSDKKSFINSSILYYTLWTLKESLSKALRLGMLSPIEIYEIQELFFQDELAICTFKNFPQFKGYSLKVNDCIFSLVFPRQLHINPDTLITKTRAFFEKCSGENICT